LNSHHRGGKSRPCPFERNKNEKNTWFILPAVVLRAACKTSPRTALATASPALPTLTLPDDAFAEYPLEARLASRFGDPRSPGY
jgi:hypothetical protein